MTRRSVAPAVLLLTLACCDRAPPATSAPSPGTPPPHAVPAAAPAAPDLPLPTFRDVAAEAGIDVVNHTGKPGDKDWIVSAMGGGAIALDYDSDGDIDLVVVDGTMLTSQGVLEYDDAWRTRLFRNDTAAGGSIKFTDVTAMSGIDLKAFGIGGASCDYDADGHPDVFVACWGPDHLFHNRGDGTFEDVTTKAGVAGGERDMSTACAWGDVDGDGVHDLYVATHVDQQAFIDKTRASGKSPRLTKLKGFALAVGPLGIAPQADRLYLGQGDGTFRDATATNLVDQTPRHGFQPVMTDLDDDGDLDIFVANDLDLNHLWVNDGRGVFHDRASAAGAAMTKESKEQAGMGVDVEDVDRDGWLDIAVTAFSNEQNTIFLNRTGRARVLAFTDASESLGIAGPSFMRTSWGVRLLDYDNDGWLDHFAACGQLFGDIPGFDEATNVPYRQRCQLLRSGGPPAWMLTEVTDASGPAFGIARTWRGAVFGDFDDDGDTDVFVTALNDRAALFRNDCESGAAGRNRFLRFRLVGKGGLRDPSGARVSLHMPGGRVHLSELHHGASFCSDNDPRLLFGVGRLEVVPRVSVRWPGGTRQTFENVQTGSGFVIEEGNGRVLPDHCAPR